MKFNLQIIDKDENKLQQEYIVADNGNLNILDLANFLGKTLTEFSMIPSGNDMALLFTDGTIVYVEDFFLPIDMLGNTAAIEYAGKVYTTSDFETSLQAAFVDTASLPEGDLNVEPLECANRD